MKNSNISNDREKIAARLKEARTLAGLSQEQAAKKLGIPRPAISEIEAGNRKVSAEEIIQFANLYQVDSDWLLLQESENEQYKFAARELSKLSKDDIQKLLHLLKVLPK
ncbi:helix-turn-helix transcriptional regulator [Chitinophagaceae bacterium LB-8]|uniref:Helix-turn-helix transcriptional regulator n=1 Tax=Paraflavisolibacter caeni TaxID=2982496 RepID=A0A9X2XNW5_9BACT|nr:helix-turn-helix transcriptional regulator [Paraflavisolibacter caeni]MCU7549823.1 helix-turn-helix transcriptional regulator [Paraflavisolibacter caeni]